MANLDRPKGFECKGEPLRINKYTAGSACYPGDLVALASDGKVDPVSAGGEILGLCMSYASADGQSVSVADHPDQLLFGQASGSEIDAQTDVGQMYDIVATAGNSTYKTSRQEINSASGQDASAQLQLIGIDERSNNALGANVVAIVRINEHQYGDSNAGI